MVTLRNTISVEWWIKERVGGGTVETASINAYYGSGFWEHLKSISWSNSQLLWPFLELQDAVVPVFSQLQK